VSSRNGVPLDSQHRYPKFIGFWGMHMVIVWAAIFLAWGLGRSPDWIDWRSTVVATLVWLVGVFAFNVVVGTNYGFVNAKPSRGSVLDYLGPWPAYVVVEIVLVATIWALMTLPWHAARIQRARATVGAC
jgi:hypothetical integral membrane protein (TIGR02206 family)